ncbi:putative uncharacterized protein DDB_G0282499 [Melanaphis sacchari]|uniref:putative uncharacterized protein DDB_G0282499 n=1 Tax=Melanaphis sacchari TaxID=742174 RepID=UPI000DC15809|nr:putative uncharacterized protein DDB_G0282499 [Melanaphis sacchari]
MEIYVMGQRWIVLMTILQVITLTTLTAKSITSAGITNYRQVKVHGRALDYRGDQQQVQTQIPTNRTFIGTNQPKIQKNADNRKPSLAVSASVQRIQQQQYNSTISYLDWTPVVQHKELLETVMPSTVNDRQDYQQQQRQLRQPDAIVTFVTYPPPTMTMHHNNKLLLKNHVQHYDDEKDSFQNINHYQNVNASDLPEINNNKRHNVTHIITDTYGAVDKHRKNTEFEFHGEMQKNKPGHQNNYNNGVNAAKKQNKHSIQRVYNANVINTERQPQNNDSVFERKLHHNAAHQLANNDGVLQSDNANNKHNYQIVNIRTHNQKHRENQHTYNFLKNGSKSDVFRDYPNNITTAVADMMASIEHENGHAEVYNMYNSDAIDMANEQHLNNYNDNIEDGNNDFYRDNDDYDPQQNVYANAIVDEWGNSAHREIVNTDSKAQEHNDNRKFENLKFDRGAPEQQVNNSQYVNMNETAARLEVNNVTTYKQRSKNDERKKIEHQRRRKISDNRNAEINPTILTTASPQQLRREIPSLAQTRRPATDDEISSRVLYDSQNVFGRKYNHDDHAHIITQSDKQPTVTSTVRAPVVRENNNNNKSTEEELKQPEQGSYGFKYTVLDEKVGMDFGQWEHRESGRTGTVTGLYRVRLPDGRIQTVKYIAGPTTGYRASVTYEGV